MSDTTRPCFCEHEQSRHIGLQRECLVANCNCKTFFAKSVIPQGDTPAVEQLPAPTPRDDMPAVWDLVLADMAARDAFGVKKYGVRLKPHDGRDALVDWYQELLDAAVYARKAIYERDGK